MSDERLQKIEQMLASHESTLRTLSGQDEYQKRYMRDLLSNLDDDNIPSLRFKITKNEMTAAISAAVGDTGAVIELLAQYTGQSGIIEAASIPPDADKKKIYKVNAKYYRWNGTAWVETDAPLSELISKISIQANSNTSQITALAQYTGQAGVITITDLAQRTDNTKVYKLGTTYYRWNGTAWVTTTAPLTETIASVNAKADANASQITALAQYDGTLANSIAAVDVKATTAGAQVSLVASYSGQSGVVTVATWSTTGKDTSKVYYATNTGLYYRYNGTAWVSSASAADAAFLLAAINGQSAAKIRADRIDFEGYATFLTADDLGENGTTEIHGGRLKTGTLYASALAAVAGAMGYNYIAMKNGLDFRNSSYMPFTQSTYTPYDRAVQGLHAVVFNGDTVLSESGGGAAGNTATIVSGYVINDQSATGAITQNGLEVGSRTFLRLMGKCFGGSTGGVSLRSANPTQMTTGATYCELIVGDTGIIAVQFQKRSDGLFDTLKTATIL